MTWLLPRLLAALASMVVGALLGLLIPGHEIPLFGAVIGLAIALGVIAVRDTLRGYRLINWLRGSRDLQAPARRRPVG